MTTAIALPNSMVPLGSSRGPAWHPTRPRSRSAYRRRRILAVLLVGLFVFCAVLVGSELLGRLHGTPGSTPVGAVGHEVIYVVQPGDTLWEIAVRLNPPGHDVRVLVDRLADATKTPSLQPGQRIVIPVAW